MSAALAWQLIICIATAVGVVVDVFSRFLQVVFELCRALDVRDEHHEMHFLLSMFHVRWIAFDSRKFAGVPGP